MMHKDWIFFTFSFFALVENRSPPFPPSIQNELLLHVLSFMNASSANCNAVVVPLEPSWVRPSRRLVRVEEVTPPNSESPIVATMSDEPEIPVPPEPTTHVLKALLAQKESLNRAINK